VTPRDVWARSRTSPPAPPRPGAKRAARRTPLVGTLSSFGRKDEVEIRGARQPAPGAPGPPPRGGGPLRGGRRAVRRGVPLAEGRHRRGERRLEPRVLRADQRRQVARGERSARARARAPRRAGRARSRARGAPVPVAGQREGARLETIAGADVPQARRRQEARPRGGSRVRGRVRRHAARAASRPRPGSRRGDHHREGVRRGEQTRRRKQAARALRCGRGRAAHGRGRGPRRDPRGCARQASVPRANAPPRRGEPRRKDFAVSDHRHERDLSRTTAWSGSRGGSTRVCS
jgi:hypothetical protein